jgi:glutamyl-tRNA reductase
LKPMPVVVVGLNHKTAPITLLERLTVGDELLPKALDHLRNYERVLEGVILSTCNRIEIYAAVSMFHGGAQDLRNFLSEFCHIAPEDFSDHLYTYHDEGAVRHLFRVAAGIDSMIVGESEILGQVRRAFVTATESGMAGRALAPLFRHSLSVGKRARTDTAIGRNPVSVSSAAVELARRAFDDGSLAGKSVAVVGAGEMGRLAARALAGVGATDVTIVNRTEDRARELADMFGAEPRPLSDLGVVLTSADIVISSTTAPGIVIDHSLIASSMQRRTKGLLFIVDIAVPHDVERSVAELDGVVLRDIEDLRGVVDASIGSRMSEVSKVEEIIAAELDRFVAWERKDEVAPIAAALVERAEFLRRTELGRIDARLESLTPEQRDAVEAMTRRIVAKLLHDPLSRMRDLSGSKQGYLYLEAIRALFGLDDPL